MDLAAVAEGYAQFFVPAFAVRVGGQDLVRQRTSIVNRFRWHLHRLDPDLPMPAYARAVSSGSSVSDQPIAPAICASRPTSEESRPTPRIRSR